jgi:hypothetical protein
MPLDESALAAGFQLGHDFFGPGLLFAKAHAVGPSSFAGGPSSDMLQAHVHKHVATSHGEMKDEALKNFGVGSSEATAAEKQSREAANAAEEDAAKEKFGCLAPCLGGTY